LKAVTINFDDDVVRSINARGMKRLREQNKPMQGIERVLELYSTVSWTRPLLTSSR
jgi:hypothetical protein